MEASIRDELLPMVYRLAFGSKVRRVAAKGGGKETTVSNAKDKALEANEAKTFDNPIVRPELVAVLGLLSRLLPLREFHLQLPRLVRSISFVLR